MFDFSQPLTEHFKWSDVTRSTTGERHRVNNTPPDFLIPALQHTASCLEAVRAILGGAVLVDSWYRCVELNQLLGSHFTSQHIKGEAVDWICPAVGTPIQLVRQLVPYMAQLKIDQIILEWSWIHTSFCANPNSVPRGNVITLMGNGGYAPGITDKNGKPIPWESPK